MNPGKQDKINLELDAHSGDRQRGIMLVFSGPSGCGKDTVAELLTEHEPYIERSISATSRAPRGLERDGVEYYFLNRSSFEEKIAQGYFLEYNEFVGNYYGIPRGPVEDKLGQGIDVLFVIDWNGARKLAAAMPEDVVRVFLLPPTMADLEQRLIKRGTETAEQVKNRLVQGKIDITHYDEYDYVIVNDDLESVLRRLQRILRAERLRRHRQPWLRGFVDGLLGQ